MKPPKVGQTPQNDEGGLLAPLNAPAAVSMARKDFLLSRRYQDQQLRAVYDGAHPLIVDFTRAFVKEAARYSIPIFSHCVVRDEDEQMRLYSQGRSKAVFGRSPHNYGMATDLVHGTRAWNLERAEWDFLGVLGKEVARKRGIKVEWGGDWEFYDPAHWELLDWRKESHNYPFL